MKNRIELFNFQVKNLHFKIKNNSTGLDIWKENTK